MGFGSLEIQSCKIGILPDQNFIEEASKIVMAA
jgi:hypothetical protein